MHRLTPAARQAFLQRARRYKCERGDVLLRQGDPSTQVYLLEAFEPAALAYVKVTATLGSGIDSMLGIRINGDIVGELAALRRGCRTATVKTCMAMHVHALSHQSFIEFLQDQDGSWEALCGMVAERLDWANRRRMEYSSYGVPVRLARILVELAERHNPDTSGRSTLQLPSLTYEELGQLIGARKDAVSQAMIKLRKARVVDSEYRKVIIMNLPKLRHFADMETRITRPN